MDRMSTRRGSDEGDGASPEEEDRFLSTFNEEFLRRALLETELHPDDLGSLLRYVPAALTHLCWRNSVLEDWHAGPDSRIFHQALWAEIGDAWIEIGPLALDLVDADDLLVAFSNALEEAFDKDRLLPHGVTLGELAGDEWMELEEHANVQLGTLAGLAEERGAHMVIMWLGLRGRSAVPRCWGTPKWPFIVDELFRRLDDPDHSHWSIIEHPGRLPAGPGGSSQLREMLICAPDAMDSDVLEFLIYKAAMGFIRDGL